MKYDDRLVGRRVRLVSTSDPYTNLQPGDCGTIDFVDDMGTLHARWDKGGRLGLIADHDVWELI